MTNRSIVSTETYKHIIIQQLREVKCPQSGKNIKARYEMIPGHKDKITIKKLNLTLALMAEEGTLILTYEGKAYNEYKLNPEVSA